MKLEELDIVYPVKINKRNDELRYSLRSIRKNLPHRSVYLISGAKINWTRGVKWIMVEDEPRSESTPFENVNRKLMEACHDEEISDPFILMNDDFFIMNPIEELPNYALGRLHDRYDSYKRKGSYAQDLIRAEKELKKLKLSTYDFEPHMPMIFYKAPLLEILQKYPESGHRRSIYGNKMKLEPTFTNDHKIYSTSEIPSPDYDLISTTDVSFAYGKAGRTIKKAFSRPCKYEGGR